MPDPLVLLLLGLIIVLQITGFVLNSSEPNIGKYFKKHGKHH